MSENKDSTESGSKSPKIVTKKRLKLRLPKFKFLNIKKLKSLNRNAVLVASLAAVLLLAGVFSLIFASNTKEVVVVDEPPKQITEIETAIDMKASLTYKEGIAEYKTDNGWLTTPKELEVIAGMSIRTTGAASRAVIALEDGSEIRLGANTEVNFETLTVARVVVVQKNGNVFNRIIPSNSRTYTIQTENAQFQDIGTAFRTIADGDEESAEVYESSIHETTTDKTADAGEKLTVKNFKNSAKDETVEKLDIEEVKKDAFITWNRDRDEKNNKFKDKLGFLSDIIGPEISVTTPKLGSTIELDSSATEGTVEIEGTTEKNSKLTVQSKSVSNSKPVDVTVASDGTFKTPVLKTAIGNSIFTFLATDSTGNKTTLSITLLFKKKIAVQQQAIALTLDNVTDPSKLEFAWGLVGLTAPDGVKLVFSETENPTYPEDPLLDSIDSDLTRSIPISDPPFTSGKTYYFRICRYITATDKCDIYSNEESVTIP